MNKQGKGKIDWCDWSWNPATGCLHGCPHCYARRLAENPYFAKGFPNKFEPHFYEDRLCQPYKEKIPAKIFTVSMGDLFGRWVPDEWINRVLKVAEDNPRHVFQFLTQNPDRYIDWTPFPKNCWIGQTSTGDLMPTSRWDENISFLSLEPLLHPFNTTYVDLFDWIIIGAKTKNSRVVEADKPRLEWIQAVVTRATQLGVSIWMKDSLKGIWQGELVKEFPNG